MQSGGEDGSEINPSPALIGLEHRHLFPRFFLGHRKLREVRLNLFSVLLRPDAGVENPNVAAFFPMPAECPKQAEEAEFQAGEGVRGEGVGVMF